MRWRRSAPLATAIVDLYGGSRAAVRIDPGSSRSPEQEGGDRLLLPLCLAARALERADGAVSARIRQGLMGTAAAIVEDPVLDGASGSWAETVAGRELVGPAGAGQPRIVVHVVRSGHGLVATLSQPDPSPLALAAATAALSGVALGVLDGEARLAAALGLEGLLAIHRHLAPGQGPPRDAVLRALVYAVQRLEEAGRPVPRHLRAAVIAEPGGRA